MSANKIFLAVLSLIFVFAFSVSGYALARGSKYDLARVNISSKGFTMLIARTPEQMSKGLGGRAIMPKDGMIFTFDSAHVSTFHMKDMMFNIYLIMVRGGIVVGLERNMKVEKGVPVYSLKKYVSPEPVDTVLEMNAGDIRKFNIKIGDKVEYKRLIGGTRND
jgi:uncharacterized membrane protein (UPF0127 family)